MPIDITADDPFTAGYKAILAVLRANDAFMEVARRFNDFSDGKLEKPLQTINAADTPEITLVQGAFLLKPFGGNSKIAEFNQTYNLVDVTDTLQVTVVNLLKFLAGCAFHHNPIEDVTWDGSGFCRLASITSAADGTGGVKLPGVSADSAARGADRLTSICSIKLDMYVPKALLPT